MHTLSSFLSAPARMLRAGLLSHAFLLPAAALEAAVPPTEHQLMQEAPHGADRPRPDVLAVSWADGLRLFRNSPENSPVFAEWTYEGYHRTAGVHLIGLVLGGYSLGVMLDERTGAVLPGGYEVRFSPDGNYYLARLLRDRQLIQAQLYRRDGTLVWELPTTAPATDGQARTYEITYLHIEDGGKTWAYATCIYDWGQSQDAIHASPVRAPDGAWRWQHRTPCPTAENARRPPPRRVFTH